MKKTLTVCTKNTILSDMYDKFTTEHSENLPTWISTLENNVPRVFKNYEYPVSSWPVIINQEKAIRLNKLSVKLPELLYQIPLLCFNNDIKKIADFYFGGNEMIAAVAMMGHEKNVDIGCRLDLTYTKKGFKVLEINMGSSIGGWQVQSFESIIRKSHPQLSSSETRHNYDSKNTQLIYIEFLVDKIVQYVPSVNNEINVFVSLKNDMNADVKKDGVAFFNDLLKVELQKRGIKGGAYSGDISSLKLVDKKLTLNSKEIHSVLFFSLDNTQEVPRDVFRAFIMDNIYFPDHLGTSFLRNKKNLALLRNLAEQGKFTPEDNMLILESIPWTSLIKDSMVVYEEQKYKLIDLLTQKKDSFVIKAANGAQGEDVFIGKFSTAEKWKTILELALEKNNFIAQEFSDSISFLAPNGSNEWVPHKLIWGSFGFGERYGGVWVRMSAVKTDVGVINSATGAVEAIVYENISSFN
ncbi:hypothetical protein [Aquimarina muelleri]|uniref:Glutathionylspermidine synthase pre-ATP-grasp-like domain-containing protein n=1 Tax=Aquimarina muelleri TaxID=279356 RepID=A0A918N417_9FLAO|nr:hypothetical protein [Aquimarina muelleri]MCX2762215.1 hypothetical protein [Aquimarina muelleri]GGX16563.1 hypothetical protein GCM10007384_17540 [Aquimarina muelleri]